MEERGWAYILASKPYGTLYAGSTVNLAQRVWQHRTDAIPGFTTKYNVKMLVWYQPFPSIGDARAFEQRVKRWRRQWKIELIQEMNSEWGDLYLKLNG